MDGSVRWLELAFNIPLNNSFWYKTEISDDGGTFTGKRAEVMLGSRKSYGFIISERNEKPEMLPVNESEVKYVLRIIDEEPFFGKSEIKLAQWISAFYLCTFGEALSSMLPSGRKEKPLADDFFSTEESFKQSGRILSEEQKQAVEGIISAGEKGNTHSGKILYLQGITGSGKTEVFLQAAQTMIERGKSVIYLVPEISLTHQVVEDVAARFGEGAAVLHSGLTQAQKLAQWRRIRRGEAKIIVGARSAVFAPAENLGLIIIDEEQDGSYKSGNTPRYHARQVAMKRSADSNCVLVMGSATPSVEAWYQIKLGRIKAYRLTQRLSGGEPPDVSIIPLKADDGILSKELKEAVFKTKQKGKQTILFLNRRGFTHFFQCKTCGFELKCRNCSVPMTWHKSKNRMQCHYCGWQTTPPSVCPECGSLDIMYHGVGTEYVENEIKKAFPDFSIQRADTDSVRKKGELKKILTDFRNGKTDILLGTQMITKGLNFPGVNLVGVVSADSTLRMPDFRASERTFSMLVQVSGRAGRFSSGGKVLIQAKDTEAPAITHAVSGNLEKFYMQEAEDREMMGFPPFTRLIRFLFRGKKAEDAERSSEEAAAILRTLITEENAVLGPAECPLAMIAGNYRFHILIKTKNIKKTLKLSADFIASYKTPHGVYLETDVDPVSIM